MAKFRNGPAQATDSSQESTNNQDANPKPTGVSKRNRSDNETPGPAGAQAQKKNRLHQVTIEEVPDQEGPCGDVEASETDEQELGMMFFILHLWIGA
jgi:hypothetical protein